MSRQLAPQQGQAAPKASVDAGHPGQGAEEGVLLCLARVVLCSTVQRAGDDLAGIALPGAPLHVEAGEAVPVQVAQLAVSHQPAIGPAWHRWTRLVRTSAAQNHLCHTSLESYGIFC